jgi:hypothetical protein
MLIRQHRISDFPLAYGRLQVIDLIKLVKAANPAMTQANTCDKERSLISPEYNPEVASL